MPNVEIHGYLHEEMIAEQLRGRIKGILLAVGLGGDAVVSIVRSDVEECSSGKKAPFLRICSTNPEEPSRIGRALEAAGIDMDVEVLPPLVKFKPKGKKWDFDYGNLTLEDVGD